MRRWSGTVAVLVAALGGCAATQPRRAARGAPAEIALARLDRHPTWLFPLTGCPADQLPEAEIPVTYLGEECALDLGACLDRCEAGEALPCYASALRAQQLKAPDDEFEALYQRACRLGVVSGCTNRAAGMIIDERDDSQLWGCANRTFEAMCQRRDPWACTMWGASLARGRGVPKDIARAMEILPKGCQLGEDDEACLAARREMMDAATARSRAPAPGP